MIKGIKEGNGRELLLKKAVGSAEALKGMTEKDAVVAPTEAFGNDYNELRRLAMEAASDVPKDIWPPRINLKMSTSRFNRTYDTTYKEVEAFTRQIIELLKP